MAYPDERAAIAHLERLLGAEVTRLRIRKLDLVHDTTVVDVCFKLPRDLAPGDVSSGHPELSRCLGGAAMSSTDQALAAFESISLAGANELAELQTRIDRKYLVDEATLWELLDAMAPTLRVLDIDGDQSCEYRSTYFDTEDLALYRAAAQGRRAAVQGSKPTVRRDRARASSRSRPRGAAEPTSSRESRTAAATTTRSRRQGTTSSKRSPEGSDLASALLPVLTTEYERSTLIDPASRTRLTFDRRLRCTGVSGGQIDCGGGEATLDAIVVETKSARAPSAADRWLWQHHVRPTKISKFCTGLAAIRPDLSANKWHRTLASHWKPQP